jgi:hypothetical protein
MAMRSGDRPQWERGLSDLYTDAAELLARDSGRIYNILGSARNPMNESIPSSVLWIRPLDKDLGRGTPDTYVPHVTKIVEAVRKAFSKRSATELASYFQKVSRYAPFRSIAGHIHEQLVHRMLTSGLGSEYTWYASPNWSAETLSSINSTQVISTASGLTNAVTLPFYFLPELANYPGIDSALCSEERVVAIQMMVSSTHPSTFGGLDKLNSQLLPQHRHTEERPWCLIFAHENVDDARALAEKEQVRVRSNLKWKNLTVGYLVVNIEEKYGTTSVVCDCIPLRDGILIICDSCTRSRQMTRAKIRARAKTRARARTRGGRGQGQGQGRCMLLFAAASYVSHPDMGC